MKYCEKCSKEYEDNLNFCPLCGEALKVKEIHCANCGEVITGEVKFCPFCGTKMDKTENKMLKKKENNLDTSGNIDVKEELIKFKIGNNVLAYDKNIVYVCYLKRACLNSAIIVKEAYKDKLNEYDNVVKFISNDSGNVGKSMVLDALRTIINSLIKEGFYALDYDTIVNRYNHQIFGKWDDLCSRIKNANYEIDRWEQSEKARREYRKDSRGKLVGGGFGLKGAAIGIAKAGAVNLATGAAHSVFNMFGNAMTSSDARNKKKELYLQSKKELIEAIGSIVLNLEFAIRPYISKVSYANDNIISMNEKIEQNLIAKKDVPAILITNLKKNPFIADTYKLLLKEMPENEFEIIAMASKFKVVSDSGDVYIAGNNFNFIDEFEKRHTIFGKVILVEAEYKQIIELKKNLHEKFDGLYFNHEIKKFYDNDFIINMQEHEHILKENVFKCSENYYIQIEEDIDKIISYIDIEIRVSDTFSLAKWYADKVKENFTNLKNMVLMYHKATKELIEYKNKRKECIKNNDAVGFFALDPKNIRFYTLGEKYLNGKDVEANLDVALAYFIKGSQENCADCEYRLAIIYSGKIFTDDQKFKYWLKQADKHGHTQAHAFLAKESDYFARVQNISLIDVFNGDELNSEFTKYVVESILKDSKKDYDVKKENCIKYNKAIEFFEIDSVDIDNYKMGLKYEEGQNVNPNIDVAMAYYLKGALASNDNNCQYKLATWYFNKTESIKDIEKLKYWMTQAKENGNDKAQKYLSSNDSYFSNIRDLSTSEALAGFSQDYVFCNAVIVMNKCQKNKNLFIRKADRNLFDELFKKIQSDSDLKGNFYVFNHLDEDKVEGAIEGYGASCHLSKEDVVLQLDNTFWGTGNDGFIAFAEGIVSHEYKKIIYFKEIEYIVMDGSEIYVKLLTEERPVEFLKCNKKSTARFTIYVLNKLLGGEVLYNDGKEAYKNIFKLIFI